MAEGERIVKINIEEEMKSAYIDYAMSVIVSRALPDVRDGLKPVHRRVLFGMSDLGLASNKSHKKALLDKFSALESQIQFLKTISIAQKQNLQSPVSHGTGLFLLSSLTNN